MNPQAARHMIAISRSFTERASFDFSNLSASWPLVAENRKNGRMNKPGSKVASVLPSSEVSCPARNVTSVISAVLKTLSLNAPRNWVKKKGRKRRSPMSWNWELIDCLFLS